jgi:hypothetical protein
MSDTARTPTDPKDIEELMAEVARLYADGSMTADEYYKCRLCGAYEYAVLGEMDRAASILNGLPEDYRKTTMRRQMEGDKNFAYLVFALGLELMSGSYTHREQLGGLMTMMPMARA